MTGSSASDALQHRPGNALRCIHSSEDPRGCGYSKECKVCNVRNGIEALLAEGGTIHAAELVLELIRNGTPQKVWMSVGAEHIQLNGHRHVCVAMDEITERKQAEAALIENELKYRSLFESADDAILLFTGDQWVDCNAGALRVFGCNREQIIGAHPIKFSPPMQPDGRPSEEEAIKKINLAFAGEPQYFEWEHCRLDGTPFAAEVSLNRLDLEGKPYMQAIVRDVSQRKQAEDALHASEQLHRPLLQTAMDGFWLADIQGNLLQVNETYCRMSGYTKQELLGMRISDLESIEVAGETVAHIQKIIEQGEDRFESRHRRKDGSFFEIEASVQYRAEEGGRLVAFLQDITERKRAEAALRESERQQLLLLQSTDQGIYGIDQEGLCTFINSSAVQMIGYQPGEVIGRNMHVLIHHTRSDGSPYPIEECPIFNAFRIGSNVRITDEVLWRKDGSACAVEYTSNPIREDGNIIGAVVTFNDITERKHAEAKLRENEASLRESQRVAHVGHWSWDTQKNQVEWSDEMKRVFGLDPATFTGDLDKLIAQAIHPDDQAKVNASNQTVLTEQKPTPLEYRIVLPDQSVRTVLAIPGDKVVDTSGKILKLTGIVQDITERKRGEAQIERQLERMSALRAIDSAINTSFELRLTLDILLEKALDELHADAAIVLQLNPHMRTLDYLLGRGLRTPIDKRASLRLDQSYAGKAVMDRRLVHISNLQDTPSSPNRAVIPASEKFGSYYGVPLIAKGQVKGVLEIYHRTRFNGDAEWLDFLETMAGQAAIAIDNSQLFQDLQRSNFELILAYDATIEGWSRALDLRDEETEGHTLRVVDLTLALAKVMGVSESGLVHVRRGALLHDIGKMGVPDAILLKSEKLTEEEWEIMRRHPTYAYDLLLPISYLRPAIDIPYCHHEKWDGTGYPRGLKGEQIPLVARLFAIVDVWDALTSDRPYRAAWTKERALEHIKAQAGTHFDPQVVQAFLKMV